MFFRSLKTWVVQPHAYKSVSASGGLRPTVPLPGLCPWTPPGDFHPLDPLHCLLLLLNEIFISGAGLFDLASLTSPIWLHCFDFCDFLTSSFWPRRFDLDVLTFATFWPRRFDLDVLTLRDVLTHATFWPYNVWDALQSIRKALYC